MLNYAAIPFCAALYIMGLLMLHLALREWSVAPAGRARRFRTDLEWLVPATSGVGVHAFLAWAFIAA